MLKKQALVLLLPILCFVSCPGKKDNRTEWIVYLPKTLSSVPLLELDTKTIAGYPLKCVFYQDNIMAMAEFLTDKCDLFYTGFTQGAAHYANDPSVLHCTTIVWGIASLVALDPGLNSLSDFAGKKIAVPFAKSPLDLQLQALLAKSGTRGVQIEYMPLQQALPMLVNARVDAVCLPEPQASQVIATQGAHEVFRFPDAWAEWMQADRMTPQVSLFVKREFATKHGSLLKDIIQNLKSALPYSAAEEEILAEKYSATFGLGKKLLQQAMHKTLYSVPDYAKSVALIGTYNRQIAFAADLNTAFYFRY